MSRAQQLRGAGPAGAVEAQRQGGVVVPCAASAPTVTGIPTQRQRAAGAHAANHGMAQESARGRAVRGSMIRKAILPVRYGGCYVGQQNGRRFLGCSDGNQN